MKKKTYIQRLKHSLFSGPASSVFNGMATLITGSLASKVIGIAAIPILTRQYRPEDFGALAVLNSLIAILMTVATLRYVLAIPLPRRDGMAINLFALSFGLMLFKCLILSLILWAFGTDILNFFSMELLAPYWWLIVVGLIASSCYEILSLWATRKRSYNTIARTIAVQSLMGNAAKLIFGIFSIKTLGLMLGQIISSIVGITSLSVNLKNDFTKNLKYIRVDRVKMVFGRYRQFPLYRLPSQFLLVLAQQIPIMFLAATFGAETLGQYALANMLVSLPIQLLSTTLSSSAYGELAKIGRRDLGRIKEILNSVTKTLFFSSLIPSILIFTLSPFIFPLIFGSEWNDAGYFASGLSIYMIAAMIAVPMPAFVNVFEKQRELMIWNLIRCFIIAFLCLIVTKMEFSSTTFVFSYGVVMLVFQMCIVIRTNLIVTDMLKIEK